MKQKTITPELKKLSLQITATAKKLEAMMEKFKKLSAKEKAKAPAKTKTKVKKVQKVKKAKKPA